MVVSNFLPLLYTNPSQIPYYTEAPHQIIQNVSSCLHIEVAANLTSIINSKRPIRSVRQLDEAGSMDNIVNIGQKKKRFIANGEYYALFNRYEQEDRDINQMIIFGTFDSVEQPKTAEHWYGDGTFNISPTAFYQVYSIHCSDNDRVFPWCICNSLE